MKLFPMQLLPAFNEVKHLGGQYYNDDDVMKIAVMQRLAQQASDFYEDGVQKLIVRYGKCLNIRGNYVEK